MTNFFQSSSIAIIGASRNPKKLGHQLLKNLIQAGFEGRIFPINLKEKRILCLPVYKSVLDVHARLDLACIIVPREIVPQIMRQCVHKEIPYILIITAGFSEKDSLGKKLERELLDITAHTKTKIIGPNCLGLVDTANHLNLTFASSKVNKGNISLILQSGAIGAAIFDWAQKNNIGINKFISLGNKVHFNELDSLDILAEDKATKIIALYLEEISEPIEFLIKCRQISQKKPIIILKGGLSKAGAKAASSHTAALSTAPELNETLFEQANLLVAQDFEELLNFLEIFSNKIFDLTSNNLAIITNAGGPGILAADAASRHGFRLVKLSSKIQKAITAKNPNFASLANPFDLGGDAKPEDFFQIINLIENHQSFSAILIIVTPQATTELEKIAKIITLFQTSQKPIIASFLGGLKIERALKILQKGRIPFYDDPAEALVLLGKIYHYWQKRNRSSKIIELQPVINQTELSSDEIIKNYNLPFVKSYLVNNDAELMGHVEEIGFPLVYKTAKKIVHRGKSGKIGLNISDALALHRAVLNLGFPGILQEMIDSPFEIIVGARRDPIFGPVMVFGQGGIFTEEKADTCLKLLPLTESDLDEMIKKAKIWPAISDFAVEDLIKNLILKLAKIILENPSIEIIELNPLKVLKKEITAVDINIKRVK